MSRRNTLENKKIRRIERESRQALQKKNALRSKMEELTFNIPDGPLGPNKPVSD